MNHSPEILCPKCNHTFCGRSESGICPQCGADFKKEMPSPESPHRPPCPPTAKPELKSDFAHDFRRFSFLCKLLEMFSRDDGFTYTIQREGVIVEIFMIGKGKSANILFNMSDPEEEKAAHMRRIIHTIVNFAA